MNKLVAAVVGTALLGTGLGLTTTPAATAVPSSYTPPPLHWSTCDDAGLQSIGAQCATLVVPLDYSKPRGTKIHLAMSRVQHTSDHYQGVMLTNPGGPGGSGLTLSVLGAYVPGTVAQDYDWIGFDPRGVGSSSPTLACDGSYAGYDRPNYVPRTRALMTTWLRLSRGYAHDCATSAGRELLGHVKTTDTVADMESMRKALGVRKLNYYGFSYGSYLGQVYATLHPSRVRRFVLDGVVNPARVWYKANLDQDVAFQKSVDIYFGWLAKYDSVYHLGTTERAVARGYYRELRKLDKTPADGVIGPDELTDVMLSAGYYVFGWEDIAAAYSSLVNDGDVTAIRAMYDGANPQTEGSDNGYAIYLGTQCTDTQWPQSWTKIKRDNWRTYAKAPFETWGNAWFNGPCSFWPAKAAKHLVHVTGRHVASKILLINETYDAATPYSGALEVRRRFPTASLIEGVDGTTHAGSLFGVACTDDTIARYLQDGSVPARKSGNRSDLRCPPNPQPDPTAAVAQQKSKSSPSVPTLRQILEAAQAH